MNNTIVDVLKQLDSHVRLHKFKGFDPYDALNSPKIQRIRSKWFKLLFTQIFVYSPLNFRPFFEVKSDINPKAIGLFLSAYCRMYKQGIIEEKEFSTISKLLVKYLLDNKTEGYSGCCWGFNFDWQDLVRYAPKKTPTIVISSYIGHSFLDLYEITHDDKYLEIAVSITKFVLHDLHIREFDTGISFSYTPIDDHVIHNANALGAAYLTRVSALNSDETLMDFAKSAFGFILFSQRKNGSWAYRLDPSSGFERNQTDFHQGFIIDSICNYIKYGSIKEEKYYNSLIKAGNFYKNQQFNKNGQAKWRLPRNFPIDVHHLAQGIISFCKIYEITKDKQYLSMAKKITNWAILNMKHETGYFYYQKWPFITNKIEYSRWGQAWMLFALSLLCKYSIYGESSQ